MLSRRHCSLSLLFLALSCPVFPCKGKTRFQSRDVNHWFLCVFGVLLSLLECVPCVCVCESVHPPYTHTLSVPTEASALIGPSHTGRMTRADPRSPGFQNEWASQCMLALELNGNVKLTTDAFCLSVEGPSHWGAQTE